MHHLGGVPVGDGAPVRIMGIINASPESFMKSSIRSTAESAAELAAQMERQGADFVDVGGMSTAPHVRRIISESKEASRLASSISAIRNAVDLPISADTPRAAPARAALDAGAAILNDISGLQYDPQMLKLAASRKPSLILCACSKAPLSGDIIRHTRKLLRHSTRLAKNAGITPDAVTVDPAIGFFRRQKRRFFTEIDSDWMERDIETLQRLRYIKDSSPMLVSVSNKSFIGRLMNADDPQNRLPGSLAFEVMAVLNGADIIRTHSVPQTKKAVQTASKMLGRT